MLKDRLIPMQTLGEEAFKDGSILNVMI